ncbi:MAG TPA: hypothetical protein VEU77_03250 [Candidatus Acidoferrales bacterium]|nr:hypothetical protein [Candidatus Acidoferrales bacterium]
MALSARDKKALLALVEQAQLVYLLTRYPKKQVLDDAGDEKKLEDGLAGLRAAAKDISSATKERASAVAWEELDKTADTPDLAWRKAKRLAPTVLRELVPLLEGEPEAAFFLRPEPTVRKAPAASGRASPRRGRAGRST